jgi:ankyrin repeat protein
MDTHSCNNLITAAYKDHDSCVRGLLASGANPNVVDDYGNTPLHCASYYGSTCFQMLADAGADPNAVNKYGWTPLQRVALGGYKACVAVLIDAGADPNAVNNHGYTSLHWAVYNNHEACVAALIAAGANPNIVNNHRRTPLQLAVKKGHRECAKMIAVHVLAYRDLTDDEWGLVPEESDIGHLLPVVMDRYGRNAAAKLVARLPKEKQKVLETAAMCLSRFVHHDVAEQILVRCV